MPVSIIIIGAGGHGRVVLDAVRLDDAFDPAGFLDADASRAGQKVLDLPILGSINLLPKLRRQGVEGAIIAIGDGRIRHSYAEQVRQAGLSLVSVVHRGAIVSRSAGVGSNVFIAAGAVVGPEAVIGPSAIVNTHASVDHECRIGEATHICPGVTLAGRVEVGDFAFIGSGATVLPCMKIGRGAVIGAGAVVREDVPDGTTVAGVPARPISRRDGA